MKVKSTLSSRTSGILLHPTSLPGSFGIGSMGKSAYNFIDFLADAGQKIWQILPLGPTGYGNSPYLCYSALAGNPLLIDLVFLQEADLLTSEDLNQLPDYPLDRVDYDLVIATKLPLLRKAAAQFQAKGVKSSLKEFSTFCERQSFWLDDYALFMAIKEANDGRSWYQWDKDLASRKLKAISEAKVQFQDNIFFHKFVQYQFYLQWQQLKQYANEKGIAIFGDIPIYVAHDSADVWAHPEIFCLDAKTGAAALMAGVPPDYFSATGQLWGNPVYDWEALTKTDFQWWIDRVRTTLEHVDIVRIDHFRGFEAFWAVPQGETTAMKGTWQKAPGAEFFTLLQKTLGDLPIVAEDLGVITPEVEALRDKFQFPGMKILHFAFDSDRDNAFLPFNFANQNCIVYTGTHDNDTTVGWFAARDQDAQARVIDYLGCLCQDGIHWALIRLALGSVAKTAIFPFQDILGLGTDTKMNTPSTIKGNWEWRCREEAFNSELSGRLKYLTYLYGRMQHTEACD